ncbi:MAG: mechanosensitive ion channel family protein [Ferroplasma sp.]
MAKVESIRKGKRDQIFKIISEVVIGVIFAIASGFIADYFIDTFLPAYTSYKPFITDSVHAVIILIVGLLVVGSFLKYLRATLIRTNRGLYGISLIVRIVFYIVILALVMSAFHVSVTGILAGSAIGGVVLGLAVQTVASNVLSSIFATSSNTIKYGEVISINSWVWSVETTGKVIDVKTLFSKLLTKDNNVIYIPNSEILGNSVITEFRLDMDKDSYIYPVSIMTAADVPADKILKEIEADEKYDGMNFFLLSKNGMTNTFEALIKFNAVTELNSKIALANMAVDTKYWDIKSRFNILGPNSIAEGSEAIYPLSITLNSDIPAESFINEAKKRTDTPVILLSRAAAATTYLANVKQMPGKSLEESINETNILMETIYNDLKKSMQNDDAKQGDKSPK